MDNDGFSHNKLHFLFKTCARNERFPFKSIDEEKKKQRKKLLKEIQSDV